MKLLIDENLSPRLSRVLSHVFPGSVHVEDCELTSSDDGRIWAYAIERGFTILTKDSDFEELSTLRGFPPKVIRLAIGNCTTSEIEVLMISAVRDIEEFLANPETAYLLISRLSR